MIEKRFYRALRFKICHPKPTGFDTQALFASIPLPIVDRTRELRVLEGKVPSPVNPPSGCRFHTRWPLAQEKCRETEPALRPVRNDVSSHIGVRQVACHFVD
jgi:oligopeptide/dipeptide ABC transporter ATP-binding protein